MGGEQAGGGRGRGEGRGEMVDGQRYRDERGAMRSDCAPSRLLFTRCSQQLTCLYSSLSSFKSSNSSFSTFLGRSDSTASLNPLSSSTVMLSSSTAAEREDSNYYSSFVPTHHPTVPSEAGAAATGSAATEGVGVISASKGGAAVLGVITGALS